MGLFEEARRVRVELPSSATVQGANAHAVSHVVPIDVALRREVARVAAIINGLMPSDARPDDRFPLRINGALKFCIIHEVGYAGFGTTCYVTVETSEEADDFGRSDSLSLLLKAVYGPDGNLALNPTGLYFPPDLLHERLDRLFD